MKIGFTLVELLVVISVGLIFTGIGLARYNDFSSQLKLKNEAKKVADVLELAKKKALSADLADKACTTFTGYRISITNSVLYKLKFCCGAVCSDVHVYDLPTNISIVSTAGDYLFTPLMKDPVFINNTITLKNASSNKCIDLGLSGVGVVELNEIFYEC